jgi:tape measure domain-containing protein
MSDFPINVKVDPGDSKSKIDDVHRTVERAEKSATAATRAMKTLGDAVKYTANQTVGSAVRGFGSLTDALQLEDKWIRTLRGDLQGYAKDVSAIDALHRRGAISAKEHADALARARSSSGIPTAKEGGMLDGIAGQALAIAGPAAVAAKAIGAITSGLEDLRARAQETRDVNVSMLRYTDSIFEAKLATEQMRETSILLGTDLKTTAGAFLDIADAAGSLNLSHEKLVDVTQSLGLIMKSEGKSIGDVGAVMSTLEFAISKGTISSGELARIMKQFPPLAKIWREEFGATNAQLLAAAENGQLAQLGFDRLITSVRTSSEVVEKNQKAWLIQNETLGIASMRWENLKQGMDLARLKAGEVSDANRKLLDTNGQVTASIRSLLGVTDAWDKRNPMVRGLDAINSRLGTVVQKLVKMRAFFDDLKGMAIAGQAAGLEGGRRRADPAAAEDKTFAVEDEIGMHSSQALESQVNSQAHLATIDAGWTKIVTTQKLADIVLNQYFRDLHLQQQKGAADLASQNDGIARGFNAIEREIRDTAGFTERMIVNAYHGIEDSIVDAFRTGKFEWESFANQIMSDLTRLAIRKAIIGGLDLFGSSGLDFTASAGGDWRIPGFAAGGGIVRGGGGATDSVVMPIAVTQGERVIVQTQGQQMRDRDAASSRGPAQPQSLNIHIDPRALASVLRTPLGVRVLDDVLRSNPGLLRGR